MSGCFYCGFPMYRQGRDRKADFLAQAGFRLHQHGREQFIRYSARTREHLTRRADGGTNLSNNVVFACGWCNHGRGSATVEEHRMRVRELVERGEHPVARAYQDPSEANTGNVT